MCPSLCATVCLSLLIMCSAATRPVSLILLIRETDTQSCTQRMEPQPFPTRHGGYGRLTDEQNPQQRGCLAHTWCWTGICCSDVAGPSQSGPNQCHTVFCRIFDLKFEGVSLLTDSCELFLLWRVDMICFVQDVSAFSHYACLDWSRNSCFYAVMKNI